VVGGFAMSLAMGGVIVAYLLLQLAYTFVLKHFVIIDVLTIAGGFVLRVLAGGVAIGSPISPYLYLSMIFLALFQGFAKRRHELRMLSDVAGSHRPSLNEYTTNILDQLIVIAAASTVVTYSLYAITTPARPAGISANMLLLTIPFILYAVFRYLFLVQVREEGGTPEEMLLTDPPLLLSVAGWAVSLLVILYVLPRTPL
jgi:4-hydroxybenzoate polyprenyltransferase